MDEPTLYLVLALLAFALAFNLQLTLAVLRAARRELHPALPLAPGERLPAVDANALEGGAPVRLGAPGQACALLFLSSQCPKCRTSVAHVAALTAPACAAGLSLWLVSTEPRWRLRGLLRGSALARHTLRLARADYRRLNPTGASPAYLFVGHEGVVEAFGVVGDDGWRALEDQLAPYADADVAA